MNGRVTFKSQLDGGTTFLIEIPIQMEVSQSR